MESSNPSSEGMLSSWASSDTDLHPKRLTIVTDNDSPKKLGEGKFGQVRCDNGLPDIEMQDRASLHLLSCVVSVCRLTDAA